MNIYAAASLFAVLILLYWVISEVFTVLFRLIGLPEEKARFQVVSLLTGTGFTTRESEMILSTRSRRRLARITVLSTLSDKPSFFLVSAAEHISEE